MQKECKQKSPNEDFVHYYYEKESTRKKMSWQATWICRRVLGKSKTEGIQIYSTRSETKTAFAERKIRAFKNIFHVTGKVMD